MSNYVQSTNFATKDALSSGDPLKIVKGTEINTEYANIAVAVATKADLASPTFTGTPTLPTGTIATTQSFGNSTTAIATTAFVQAAMALLHPIGSILINATNSANPNTYLGFGTWVAFGAGRVPVGFNAGNPLFDTAEETGGSADSTLPTHTHAITDPGHFHNYDLVSFPVQANQWVGYATDPGPIFTSTPTTTQTTGITNQNAGSSGTNANYQPYITVFMFKRTA